MIKPWIFEFFHALTRDEAAEPGAVKRQFDRHLDLWARDEALGFEGIFFSEHHFGPAYSPSPHLLVAAMAHRTKTMRLGTLGVSTAYVSGLRFVEESAMLDNLTDGRLEIGIVRGIPQEFARMGMTPEEGDERFERALREVDAALNSADTDFRYGGLEVEPPMRQRTPPRWLAIISERSARRAAGLGWKVCAGFMAVSDVEKIFDAYREEAGIDRAASLDRLALRRRVLFVESREGAAQARQALKEHALDHIKAGLRPQPGQAQPIVDLDAIAKRMLNEDEFIVGTPADVAEEIIAQCRSVGCGHFLAGLDSTNIFEDMRKAHEIFGREVIPQLRKAELLAAGTGA